MLQSFDQIFKIAKQKGAKRFAVAGPEGAEVLKAVDDAYKRNLMVPTLFGNQEAIQSLAGELQISLQKMEIVHCQTPDEAAQRAVRLIADGKADALMKGMISSPLLLRQVLRQEFDLRTDRLLSHIAILDIPAYHKLVGMTDGGMVPHPSMEQKAQILENGLDFLSKLGLESPKVAILAANEKVSENLPETVDAAQLVQMAVQGRFGKAIIEGPVSLDIAFSKEAAQIKHIESQVAGDVDLLLMPDVSCGNIFAKGLVYMANALISGIIVGAKMPIVLISRAEKTETLVRSIALACAVS
ncbi:bifunctional enoyl-CoA hydratase/phosphate acetyltransferase [candidate division KSB1 bacterium]|nr:bifunctional enoyl-CoA hydratase/phosphate acetyltransferase [candidate division KSB1 bacterium]